MDVCCVLSGRGL